MSKVILLTGGAGFVGANLIRGLLAKKYVIHTIIRKGSSIWRLDGISKKIEIHEGILDDKNKLKKLFEKIKPYAVFHLSTYGAYPTQQDLNLMIETNIKGTINLLEASNKIPYKHMVVVGSSSEYGEKNKPMGESDVLEPNNFYAATKAAQTHIAQVWAYTFHKPIIIPRFFSVYGPFEEKGRLVRSVVESALSGSPIKLATGKEARDLIFVEDVVNALIYIISRRSHEGQIFNIGTGKQTTILQLAKKVKGLTKSNSPIQLNSYPGRRWDTYRWVSNMNKTKRFLKWKSKYSLDEGLKKTIAWCKDNEDAN